MSRILCLRLPDWPQQRLAHSDQPPPAVSPVLLFERDGRGVARISFCCSVAAAVGVRIGMPLAEAKGLLGEGRGERGEGRGGSGGRILILLPHDRAADRSALEHLALWCEQFSPLVGLETAEHPECLLLDITGSTPLFGGEEQLATRLRAGLVSLGYTGQVAIADTVGAAWALASSQEERKAVLGTEYSVLSTNGTMHEAQTAECAHGTAYEVPSAEYRVPGTECGMQSAERKGEADISNFKSQISNPTSLPTPHSPLPTNVPLSPLPSLPPSALRLPPATLSLLTHLGLTTIGHLLALPREALAVRFAEPDPASGCSLLTRLDQALGRIAEPIVSYRPLPEIEAAWRGEHPLTKEEHVLLVLRPLVDQIAAELRARRRGAAQVACRLDCERGGPGLMEIGLYRPTASAEHLVELLEMQLARQRLPAGVTGICLKVLTSAPLEEEQGELFADGVRNAERQQACLIDRLTSRLGPAAVVAARRRGDALPERAVEFIPQVEAQRTSPNIAAPVLPPRRPHARTRPRGARVQVPPAGKPKRTRPRPEPLDPAAFPTWLNAPATKAPLLALWPEPAAEPPRVPAEAFDRPLFLTASEPIEVISLAPHGPPARLVWRGRPYNVARTWGPERIETGWWRGTSARRDYYRVETQEGEWFWIYQELSVRKWKLQGRYG